MSNHRENLLALLGGERLSSPPCFSGLISVTLAGLEAEGLQFSEVHHNAVKMMRAAASTYRLSGFGSAVAPLDLCVEAEALGAKVDFRAGSPLAEFPRIAEFLHDSLESLTLQAHRLESREVVKQGRIPLVCEAIGLLKEEVGEKIVVGGWVPGPFTLLSLLVETGALYLSLRKAPQQIHEALAFLTQVLGRVGAAYQRAGADFLTVHEMGGSPGALGPRIFETIVLPHLQALISALPRPVVLSVCGRTNGTMRLLAAAGADALSVDQTNDLAASRKELPEALLFGNLDPVGLLSRGRPAEITEAVRGVIRSGADAVWPGCDLYPYTPVENLRALVQASGGQRENKKVSLPED